MEQTLIGLLGGFVLAFIPVMVKLNKMDVKMTGTTERQGEQIKTLFSSKEQLEKQSLQYISLHNEVLGTMQVLIGKLPNGRMD